MKKRSMHTALFVFLCISSVCLSAKDYEITLPEDKKITVTFDNEYFECSQINHLLPNKKDDPFSNVIAYFFLTSMPKKNVDQACVSHDEADNLRTVPGLPERSLRRVVALSDYGAGRIGIATEVCVFRYGRLDTQIDSKESTLVKKLFSHLIITVKEEVAEAEGDVAVESIDDAPVLDLVITACADGQEVVLDWK